jgi:predicted O-methyltransferase YrrM
MAFHPKAFLKGSLVKAFHLGQRLGVDVLPRHFYSEIPSIAKLKQTEAWRHPYSMIGVQGVDLGSQLEFVRSVVTPEVAQYLSQHDVRGEASRENGAVGYGPVEAQMLFAFAATKRPQRIVQIGCGVSTAICIAAGKFAGYRPEITCIEPYPTDFLQRAAQSGDIQLIRQPVENIGVDFLKELQSGDLFFVDSTHTLGPAGEVTRIITEMLPRISRGCFVHFHDIFFPYDYSPRLLAEAMFFWHESALLHAFLCMNPSYRIAASLSMLHNGRAADLQTLFSKYAPMKMSHGIGGEGDFPSSTYLEVVA